MLVGSGCDEVRGGDQGGAAFTQLAEDYCSVGLETGTYRRRGLTRWRTWGLGGWGLGLGPEVGALVLPP